MRKQFISFKEEEQNTMQFLEKLNKFKSASKAIKHKNIETAHKVEWAKEFARLNKMEKQLTKELDGSLKDLDLNYEDKISVYNIFQGEKMQSFSTFYSKQSEQREINDLNIWYQVQNFAEIVNNLKLKKNQPAKPEPLLPQIKKGQISNTNTTTKNQQKGCLKQPQAEQKGPQNEFNMEELTQLKEEISLFLGQMSDVTNEEMQFMQDLENRERKRQEANNQIMLEIVEADNEFSCTNENMEQSNKDGEDFYDGDINKDEREEAQQMAHFDSQIQGVHQSDYEGIMEFFNMGDDDKINLEEEEKYLIQQYNKALGFIKERYKLEIEHLQQEYEDVDQDPDFIKNNNKNYQEFYYIYLSYLKRGKDMNSYMERLQIHFPKISKKTLEMVDSIIQRREYKRQRLNALYRLFQTEKQELKRKVEEQLISLLNQRILESQKNLEKIKIQQEHIRLSEELEQRKVIFEVKLAKTAAEKQADLEKQLQEDKRKQELWNQHTKIQKEKAVVFTQEKQHKLVQIQQEQNEKLIKQKFEQKMMIEKNRDKVELRQASQIAKLNEQQYKKEEKIRLAEEKKQKIDQAIEEYSFRPNVEPDFNRLQQHTESLIQKKQVKYDKADKIDLVKVNGFNIGQLMSDMRYRLSSALAEAGVVNTNYANNVLNALNYQNKNY